MKDNFATDFNTNHKPYFVGRKREMEWLDYHLIKGNLASSPIIIFGAPGVGKTTLLKQWFSLRQRASIWFAPRSGTHKEALNDLLSQIEYSRDTYKHKRDLAVVVDGSDFWNQKQHEEVAGKIFNYKFISSLVFIRNKDLKLSRSHLMHLGPFSPETAQELLKKILPFNLSDEKLRQAIKISKGSPLVLSLFGRLIQDENFQSIISTPQNPLYKLENNILVPKNEIITAIKPTIISASNSLVSALKKQPRDLYKLSPREFEKLLADLLKDMGWDVELTKQTRDGGSDILAYLNTSIGRLLCLVEAKHYREDRKIGVDLVRTLYGTLYDAQANSAMMVTTSSFTNDAKIFQQKHKYQLSLKDYADVVEWILKFGNPN
jgi:hypothetical protein